MAISLISGPTISAGESLSPSIATGTPSTGLVAIVMPPDWTDAPLTFQLSVDGTNFFDLFDKEGRETEFVVTPGAIVPLATPTDIQYLKLRSGPRASPIPQEVDRVFSILVQ